MTAEVFNRALSDMRTPLDGSTYPWQKKLYWLNFKILYSLQTAKEYIRDQCCLLGADGATLRALVLGFHTTLKQCAIKHCSREKASLFWTSPFNHQKIFHQAWSDSNPCQLLLVSILGSRWGKTFFFASSPKPLHVFHLTLPQMAWLGFIFSLTPMPRPGIKLTSAQLHLFKGP